MEERKNLVVKRKGDKEGKKKGAIWRERKIGSIGSRRHGRSQDFFRGGTLFQKIFQKILKKYAKNLLKKIAKNALF